jgi:hypothetical protein
MRKRKSWRIMTASFLLSLTIILIMTVDRDVMAAMVEGDVGQEAITSEDAGGSIPSFSGPPEWFAAAKIVSSIDERTTVAVLQKAAQLQSGEMLELVTTLLPAPGIDIMKRKGLRVWSVQQGPELIRTYVSKPCE